MTSRLQTIPPFKEWFEAKYGIPYPALKHEYMTDVWARMAEALAAYADEIKAALDD